MPKEVDVLKSDFASIGEIIIDMLRLATDAYFTGDDALANQVLELEQKVNRAEVEMEEKCQNILTIHRLDATSTRWVLSILKATIDLERVGDFCFKLAKRALDRLKPLSHPQEERLKELARIASTMLYDSLNAFNNEDQMLARTIGPQDPAADGHKNKIHLSIPSSWKTGTANPADLEVILTASDLERIADHATNIAEEILVLPTGSIQRHQVRSERERL